MLQLGLVTAVCISIDRFLQNAAPPSCLPFDRNIGAASAHSDVDHKQVRDPDSPLAFICRAVGIVVAENLVLSDLFFGVQPIEGM